MADDDDFELIVDVSKKSRYIFADTFDKYASDLNMKAYLKTLNTHEFASLHISDYPSAFDHVVNGLKKKFGYGMYLMHDAIFYYGLMQLWQIIKELDIIDAIESMDEIKKHIEISSSKVKNIYEVGGDVKDRVFKVSSNSSAFCGEISRILGTTKKSVALLAMLITFQKSEYVTQNYVFVVDSYLFEFDSNLKRMFENYSDNFIVSLHPYSKTLYNTYISELIKKEPDIRLLSNLLTILLISKKYGHVDGDLIDYKDVVINGRNIFDKFKRINVELDPPGKVDISCLYNKKDKLIYVEPPDVDVFDELNGYIEDEKYNNSKIETSNNAYQKTENNVKSIEINRNLDKKDECRGYISCLYGYVKKFKGIIKRSIQKVE